MRTALIVGVLLMGGLALGGCGLLQSQVSSPTVTQFSPHSLLSTGPPLLSCQASALPLGAPTVAGWHLKCSLVQAPAGDTHFTVELMLLDGRGNAAYFFSDVCQGVLLQGQGDCQANFFTPAGLSAQALELFAVSLPSNKLSNSVRPLGGA